MLNIQLKLVLCCQDELGISEDEFEDLQSLFQVSSGSVKLKTSFSEFSEFTEAVWLTSKWRLYHGLIPIFKGDICNWFLVCCRLLSLICFKFWNITLLLFNITWLILDHLVIESCNWNPTNWLAVRPNIDWFWLLNCTYCVSVSFLTTYALSLAPFWQLIDWRLKLFDC